MEDALSLGADPTGANPSGVTPIHSACIAGDVGIVRLLIGRASLPAAQLLALGDVAGMTPLHYASSEGNADVVRYLLSLGASVSATTVDSSFSISRIPILMAGGKTPLHLAAERVA